MESSSSFRRLPNDLLVIIGECLSQLDYHGLLNSSKREFRDAKVATIHYYLNIIFSLRFLFDVNFRNLILSNVKDSMKQLSLNFNNYEMSPGLVGGNFMDLSSVAVHSVTLGCYFMPFEPFSRCESVFNFYAFPRREFPFLPNLKEVAMTSETLANVANLSHLQNVKLDGCNALTDISGLHNVPTLTLCACNNIENFSFLGRQTSLTLMSLSISDVSHLGNVRILKILSCENVMDVSTLGNVYDLTLSSCPKIEDISGLGKGSQKILNLEDCAGQITGMESLRNVPHISLSIRGTIDCNIFSNAKSVAILGCNEELDMAPLHSVSSIELSGCSRIKNLVALKNVDHFTYHGGNTSQDYSSDPSYLDFFLSEDHNHKSLTIDREVYQHIGNKFMKNVKCVSICGSLRKDVPVSVRALTGVESLELSSVLSFDYQQISLLKNLQRVRILKCDCLCDVNGFGGIHTVELSYCDYLTDITGFGGKNHTIRLEACPEINDFHSLCNIPYVTLLNCFTSYDDISYLSTVPRLRVVCIGELESSEEYKKMKQLLMLPTDEMPNK
jgi:hypothetical protein